MSDPRVAEAQAEEDKRIEKIKKLHATEDDGSVRIIYQGDWRFSREVWVFAWCMLKVFVYFLFMAGNCVSDE